MIRIERTAAASSSMPPWALRVNPSRRAIGRPSSTSSRTTTTRGLGGKAGPGPGMVAAGQIHPRLALRSPPHHLPRDPIMVRLGVPTPAVATSRASVVASLVRRIAFAALPALYLASSHSWMSSRNATVEGAYLRRSQGTAVGVAEEVVPRAGGQRDGRGPLAGPARSGLRRTPSTHHVCRTASCPFLIFESRHRRLGGAGTSSQHGRSEQVLKVTCAEHDVSAGTAIGVHSLG